MRNTPWILCDTETTGFTAPVFVVELAAQRMRGWQPEGVPFRKLLNQNEDIPAEASRVHGYTREILERDGEPPREVYRDFAEYAGDLPLVSFNLEYDLDEVLKPEWKRLRLKSIGTRGFCALRLAQRLLDPVPAGNCKLQTLRQYYRLPERGAHTALGDVDTVADLMAQVLRPIAEHRRLDAWDKIVKYAAEEWFPSRIAFGKHKGRLFQEARQNVELRHWLDWLARSSRARNAKMGRWYLKQLEVGEDLSTDSAVFAAIEPETAGEPPKTPRGPAPVALVLYVHPELEQLQRCVAEARERLAQLEVTHIKEKSQVNAIQAVLFQRLREHYQKRDRLRLVVHYRKKYLDSLIHGGEEEAQQAEANYEQAKTQANKDYEDTAAVMAHKRQLSTDEEGELNRLWKQLVKLYHPDRFSHEPDKLKTYEKLVSAINRARDNGDMATLRQIAQDPHAFILRQGWTALDFSEEVELAQLRRLYETLQLEIISILESLGQLRESPEYELCQISGQKPEALDGLVAERASQLEKESAELEEQANRLDLEIKELCGVKQLRIC